MEENNPKGDNNKNERSAEANRLYSVNESLLQSYRGIFISSESFMLSVGFLQFNGRVEPGLFYTIIILNLLIILFGWVDIVRARAKLVDYYKFTFDPIPETEAFIKNHKIRKAAYQSLNKKKNKKKREKGPWRETRIKIDLILPALYLIVWLLIFYFSEITCDKCCGFFGIFPNKPTLAIIVIGLITITGVGWNLWSEFRNKKTN